MSIKTFGYNNDRGLRWRTVADVLARIVADYPAEQAEGQRRDIPRIAFNIGLVASRVQGNARVADIGGGLGLFSPGCAALGMSSVLVDDFRDLGNIPIAEHVIRRVHQKWGVEVISRDVVAEGVDFPNETLDAVTTFESMEHWHHSPKRLFQRLLAALKPGGLFVVSAPNCVNLRKRITVPLGIGKWSTMQDWYETEVFRGHVREPDVRDLQYIASDLRLQRTKILGRNWQGYDSRFGSLRALMPLVDRLARPFPAICADLYLVGHKGE